jgi:predicted ATPase
MAHCSKGLHVISNLPEGPERTLHELGLQLTMSFGRLLWKQGRTAEARATVQSVYNWFTEGFDTADLMDAKALLDEMAVG